jgi:hypothetical protein
MKSFSVMANELILAVSAASWVARTFACRRTTAPQFKTGEKMRPRALVLLAACTFAGAVVWGPTRSPAAEESRFAHADSRSRYVHWMSTIGGSHRNQRGLIHRCIPAAAAMTIPPFPTAGISMHSTTPYRQDGPVSRGSGSTSERARSFRCPTANTHRCMTRVNSGSRRGK